MQGSPRNRCLAPELQLQATADALDPTLAPRYTITRLLSGICTIVSSSTDVEVSSGCPNTATYDSFFTKSFLRFILSTDAQYKEISQM